MASGERTSGVVTKGDPRIRPHRVSRELVRLGIAGILLVVAFLGSAATQLFRQAQQSIEERDQIRPLAALDPAAQRLSWQVDRLSQSLDPVSAEVGDSRIVANLGSASPLGAAAEMDALLSRARQLAFSWRQAGDVLKRKYDELEATPSILPTSGFIGSKFSWNRLHPILGRARPHLGVDIVAPMGTPVVASARGRVAFVGRRGEFGLMVEIDHGSGRTTRYAHLSRAVVRLGQRLERGEILGRVGKSGLAAGPHLHYEVLVNGRPANPRTFIESQASQD
jgi:murein DD-endopeptidase MepM/ murein hydrolase activator NlpD